MGATLIDKGVVIGECSHRICDCVVLNQKPQGCLNFIPKGALMGVHLQVSNLVDQWLRAQGLTHSVPADLVSQILAMARQEVAKTAEPVTDRYAVVAAEIFSNEWLPSVEAAVQHAQEVFDRHDKNLRAGGRTPNPPTKRMIIVKADRMVERVPPTLPPVNVRDLTNSDFPAPKMGKSCGADDDDERV